MSTMTRRRRIGQRPPGRRGRATACALVVCTILSFTLAAPTAGADEVTDLEARADRIATQLLDLQNRIAEIGEQFNQSQVRRAELAEHKSDLEQRSRVARLEMLARRADASRYAMSAYVGLDQGDVLSMALDGRQWDLSRRTGYAAISIGDREQLVDDLQAAEKVNDDLVAEIAAAGRKEETIAGDLKRQEAEATRLIADQESLQNSVQGELAVAVARRQAAITAAQQAAATPGTTTGPGTSSATAGASGPGAGAPGGTSGATPLPARPVTPGGTVAPGTTPTTPPGAGPTNPAPPTTRPPVTNPPAPAPPPIAPPPATGRGQTAANAAITQIGVRYSWGGGNASGPSEGFGPGAGIVGFDCSGLTLYAWARAGVSLPHSAQMQYNLSAKVALSQLQPGDLVFYGSSSTNISHVGIYVGGGQVVHAPNSRSLVQYGAVNLWNGYYAWIGAGRPG